MTKRYFITGTDTGIGKTWVCRALLESYNQKGLKTLGIKPLASGGEQTAMGFQNEDARILQAASSFKVSYEEINPFIFEAPVSPHIASAEAGVRLTAKALVDETLKRFTHEVDVMLIEGCGGFLVPINESETMADYAKLLNIPVILVVGMRLGCLNHSLLTVSAIERLNIPLAGWVANVIDPNMLRLEENIAYLEKSIQAPLLSLDNSYELP